MPNSTENSTRSAWKRKRATAEASEFQPIAPVDGCFGSSYPLLLFSRLGPEFLAYHS
jgi:hypothetical protein